VSKEKKKKKKKAQNIQTLKMSDIRSSIFLDFFSAMKIHNKLREKGD
jgi:hypothetical protein